MRKFLSVLLALWCTLLVLPAATLAAQEAQDDKAVAVTQEAAGSELPPSRATEKLSNVENYLYGTEQEGSLKERVDIVESDFLGALTSKALLTRIDNLYNEVRGGQNNEENTLCFAAKLNAVESEFKSQIDSAPAKTRLEALEKSILGKEGKGALKDRAETLLKQVFPADSLAPSTAVLPMDALIKVEFTEEISSKTAKAGDDLHYRVAENIYVGNTLVIPKGAKGFGTVKKVVGPKMFGKDARIDLEFTHVYSIDGQKIPVYVGELAKQEAKSIAGAAGASIGGAIILGPVGLVGGAFVKGQSVVIKSGCTTFVQVKAKREINGYIRSDETKQGIQAIMPEDKNKKHTTAQKK